jgi:peptidoglycan/LPS O-acetylase OafA/YrhL
MFYLGSGALLLASLGMNPSKTFGFVKGAAWLGKHSYSVYIWHMAVLEYFVLPIRQWGYIHPWPGLYFLFFFASSWFIGVLFAKLVELPALKVRDRLFPSRCRPHHSLAEPALPKQSTHNI